MVKAEKDGVLKNEMLIEILNAAAKNPESAKWVETMPAALSWALRDVPQAVGQVERKRSWLWGEDLLRVEQTRRGTDTLVPKQVLHLC